MRGEEGRLEGNVLLGKVGLVLGGELGRKDSGLRSLGLSFGSGSGSLELLELLLGERRGLLAFSGGGERGLGRANSIGGSDLTRLGLLLLLGLLAVLVARSLLLFLVLLLGLLDGRIASLGGGTGLGGLTSLLLLLQPATLFFAQFDRHFGSDCDDINKS